MLQTFVGLGTSTRYADISSDAIDAAKVFILDCLAIGVAGKTSPYRDALLQAALGWGHGDEASLLGDEARVSPTTAAYINTFQMHCLEFDCVHEPAVAHVVTAVLGASLAEVEQTDEPIDGELFLAACVLGVEVAATLGLAANASLTFFRPATTGVFGAAFAVAYLRGYDQQQFRDTFGYALSQAAGTMQPHEEGKPTLPIQLGSAARAGLMAADLAATGIPTPEQSIDGRFGYLALFESQIQDQTSLADLTASIGKQWRITELSHKPFPSGRATHGGIEAVLRLREKGVREDNVASLVLSAPPLIHQLVIRPITREMNVNYARLCFPYVGAIALRTGSVGLGDFDASALADPVTLALAEKFSATVSDVQDPAAFVPQSLVATLLDGSVHETHVTALLGSPDNPLPQDDCHAKVRACLGMVYDNDDRADYLISITESLERADDVRMLLTPITGTFP